MAPTDLTSEFFNVTLPFPYVAHVEINRPRKLNSWTEPMFHTLGTIFASLSTDPSVRAIVLTGAGDRAFTSGLDVQAAANSGPLSGTHNDDLDVARRAVLLRRHIHDLQAPISEIEKCGKPVITVLHGISYGAAIDIACASDIRIAAKGTRFSVREVEIGLAADLGTLTRLPKANVPFSWIKDVCLTAREFDAEEALRVGLVSGVEEGKKEAVERAMELAKTLALKSPVAVQGTKAVLNYSRDHSVADGLDYIQVWNAAMLQTDDVKNALLAGIQKRKPTFEKL